MGELRIIGRSSTLMFGDLVEGEIRLTWTKDDPEDIHRAEKMFREYTHKGWLAIGEVRDKKVQIFSFDPDLERIVLAPIVVGG